MTVGYDESELEKYKLTFNGEEINIEDFIFKTRDSFYGKTKKDVLTKYKNSEKYDKNIKYKITKNECCKIELTKIPNKNDISFSNYSSDENIYYASIRKPSENQNKFYVLEFNEDEESGYHNESYISFSYDIENIFNVAVDFFETEADVKDELFFENSEIPTNIKTFTNIEKLEIENMKTQLLNKGFYQVPKGITYNCTFKLFTFNF